MIHYLHGLEGPQPVKLKLHLHIATGEAVIAPSHVVITRPNPQLLALPKVIQPHHAVRQLAQPPILQPERRGQRKKKIKYLLFRDSAMPVPCSLSLPQHSHRDSSHSLHRRPLSTGHCTICGVCTPCAVSHKHLHLSQVSHKTSMSSWRAHSSLLVLSLEAPAILHSPPILPLLYPHYLVLPMLTRQLSGWCGHRKWSH